MFFVVVALIRIVSRLFLEASIVEYSVFAYTLE
jgi:hypothetical protein